MKTRLISLILAALLLAAIPASASNGQAMSYSDGLVDYIKRGEGYRAMPYASGGNWLIGYGCLCNPADYPNGISEAGAEALLRSKLDLFAGAINKLLDRYGVRVTQGQFDALCGLSYSVGTAWTGTVNRLSFMLIRGLEHYSEQEIATAFAVWCHVGSSPNTALLRRRSIELDMFFNDRYEDRSDQFRWLILDPAGGENEYSDVAMFRAGVPYGTLPKPTRSGYAFTGWQTAEGRVLKTRDTVTENLRVSATWVQGDVAMEPGPEPEVPETPPEETVLVSPFPDVSVDSWYARDVIQLTEKGIVSGFDDGRFHPNRDVTWGQALKLVLLAAGFPEQKPPKPQKREDPEGQDGEAEAPPEPHWAEGYRYYGALLGYPVTDAESLDKPVTRYEMAALVRAALELPESTATSPYADASGPAVRALYAAGIMQGSWENGQRVFKGNDNIRRSEISAVLVRMEKYVQGHFVFVAGARRPIRFDWAMSEWEPSAFVTDERERMVYEDPGRSTRLGIDVSSHQGEIDWQAVAADGVEFAILRVGFRGYGRKGTLNDDERFEENLAGALAAGLDVGVYFFSQAVSVEEAQEEADFVLERIQGLPLTMPVVFDWEQMTNEGSRTARPDYKVLTDCALAFCERIGKAGFEPMVYLNKTLGYLVYDLSRMQHLEIWLAWYHPQPDFVYAYRMWQYSDRGKVNGIDARVDMNIWLK